MKYNTPFGNISDGEWNETLILEWLPDLNDWLSASLEDDLDEQYFPAVIADIEGPRKCKINETIQFSTWAIGGNSPYTFEWDFDSDGIIDSTEQNPAYKYTTEGDYTVKLTVKDKDGKIAQSIYGDELPTSTVKVSSGKSNTKAIFNPLLATIIAKFPYAWCMAGG